MSYTEAAASYAARAFFYPSLMWNLARNRLQETWHWWDEITENVVLGAIPFYSTLEEFKKLEVKAVVTLNEGFEVFITTEQYEEYGIAHLHIPTVDFLYAPPTCDLHKGVDWIHGHASEGRKTYVHCKAGRGRSTTLVVCYLIKYFGQTPEEAYTFVRERRPQVCLALGQWTAVCAFYISCRPDEGLKVEDFPYPTLLPLAPGKQGTDGTEAPEASIMEGKVEEGPGAEGSQQESGEGEGRPGLMTGAVTETDPQPGGVDVCEASGQEDRLGGPAKETDVPLVLTSSSCPQPHSCSAGEGSGSSVQISASSTQAADSDDMVVLLSSLGSTATSGSDLSLGNIATALGSCCIHPRPDRSKEGVCEPSAFLNGAELQPPQRAASPAIEIPTRGRSPEPKPLGKRGTLTPSSKGSITLEPSGSLPGYVRIAPATLASISSGETPHVRPHISATGFILNEDWADVSRSQGDS